MKRIAVVGCVMLWVVGLALVSSCHRNHEDRTGPGKIDEGLVPLLNEHLETAIKGQYIVALKSTATAQDLDDLVAAVKQADGTIGYTYTATPPLGFSAKLPDAALLLVRKHRQVDHVELDQRVQLETIQSLPGGGPGGQNPANGLDRIDRRFLPLNGTYTYDTTGMGVHVYVVDTGIKAGNAEFGGRVTGGWNTQENNSNTDDCAIYPNTTQHVAHGTAVAGIIGGTVYGVAKNVELHPLKIFDCNDNSSAAAFLAAFDWISLNAVKPAVVNFSTEATNSPMIDAKTQALLNAGITVVASADDHGGDVAGLSPGRVAGVISVSMIDPTNDSRVLPSLVGCFSGTAAGYTSGMGATLSLFAPGWNIWTAGVDTPITQFCGSSAATPFVAGVAALILGKDASLSPAMVWAKIDAAANKAGTMYVDEENGTTHTWNGIQNADGTSPNKMLHWGSRNDGFDDGDPHLTTVNGVHYDFQAAGEFVLLRDPDGLEIQTRQQQLATSDSPKDPSTKLPICVSVNKAVAARVGKHRVTYQPDSDDDHSMQLRIDGTVSALSTLPIDFDDGGRVLANPAGSGIQIEFPDDTVLTATTGSMGSTPLLNLNVQDSPALMGLLGFVAPQGWLPALADGTTLGSAPADPHQRLAILYEKFAPSWRVQRSLFDYAAGQTTQSFTDEKWPLEGACNVAGTQPLQPVKLSVATAACAAVKNRHRRADCVFDVTATGAKEIATTYEISERIDLEATTTTVWPDNKSLREPRPRALIAVVRARHRDASERPRGTVQFSVDGEPRGRAIPVDERGLATLADESLTGGKHKVLARYEPAKGEQLLPSVSRPQIFTGEGGLPPR